MLVLALLMTLLAARYLPADPDAYFAEQRRVYEDNTFAILGHILGASIAMILGPFQFLPRQRQRLLGLHRWAGRLYLTGVGVGSVFGFIMAWLAYGGIVSSLGFATLAVLWLSTGAMALARVRSGDIQAHRDWMVRNYALTLAAVTLRIWLPLLSMAIGIEFTNAYRTVAWLCWIPNLILAERIIRTTNYEQRTTTSHAERPHR
jgi:uncharacterized membrane protein